MEHYNLKKEHEGISTEEHSLDTDAMPLPNTLKDLAIERNDDPRDDEATPLLHKGLFSGLFKNQDQYKVKDSPLADISDLLKQWGLPLTHLRVASLITLGFNSARLGQPIHLALTEDEGAGAEELLNLCRRLTPKDGVVEFLDIPDVSHHSLNGKTIFLPGYEGKNKKLRGLVRLLKSDTVSQPNFKGIKNASDVTEGPTALICFVKEKKSEILDLQFIFHLHLISPNLSNFQRALLEEKMRASNLIEPNLDHLHLKALLFRLSPQKVNIPFFEMLVNFMSDNIHNNLEIIRFVTKVIKLVTVVNHFEPATKEEVIETYLNAAAGEGVGHVPKGFSLFPTLPGQVPFHGALTATIYDYYCAKCLLEGLPLNSGEQLASRTLRVYEAIKNMNLDYLTASCGPLKSHEVLNTLEHQNHTRGWPGVREIFEKVNQKQEAQISQSAVNKEVEFLLEYDHIQRREVARNPVKYVYAIKTLSVGPCSMTLPNPKDLYDSSLDGPIVGRNPLTGEVEEI